MANGTLENLGDKFSKVTVGGESDGNSNVDSNIDEAGNSGMATWGEGTESQPTNKYTHYDIIIFNVKAKTTAFKNAGVESVLKKHTPDLVLVQECNTATLEKNNFPDYTLAGCDNNANVGLIYASKVVDITIESVESILKLCSETEPEQPISKQMVKSKLLDRMHIAVVTYKKRSVPGFICISWHGRNHFDNCDYDEKTKVAGKNKKDLLQKEQLSTLMSFLRLLVKYKKMPLLVGGDFNVSYKNAAEICKEFVLYEYEPSTKRGAPINPEKKTQEFKLIDYFLSTKDIRLTKPQELQKSLGADEDGFDHDPVGACIENANKKT